MDFEFTEEQKMFRTAIREFAEKELRPLTLYAEEHEEFPAQIFPMMGDLGFLCMGAPAKYGGAEAGMTMECISTEEIGRVNSGFCSATMAQAQACMPIWRFCSEEQKQKYLPEAIKGRKVGSWAVTEPSGGSDVRAIEGKAYQNDNGDWVINANKTFITNAGLSDFINVAVYTGTTRSTADMSVFIVETDNPGYKFVRKLHKTGNRTSNTCEIAFEDCVVPDSARMKDDDGKVATFREVAGNMSTTRIFQGARALGLARAAFEDALNYTKERIVFGKPIALHQYNSFRLAEMAVRIEAARWLVYYSAWLHDHGTPSIKTNSMAKYYANDTAVYCAREAKELFGGYGHCMDFPVSHYLGDAVVGETGEGTAEIQKQIIARELGLKETRGK